MSEVQEDYTQSQSLQKFNETTEPQLREFNSVKNLTSEQIECLIYKIEDFKGEKTLPLIEYYKLDFVMSLIDKAKIGELENTFSIFPKKGVDIIDFVKIFLTCLKHKPHETLYLSLSLIDLFKEITESRNSETNSQILSINDVTAFVCEYFVEKNITTYLLPTLKVPEQRKFAIDAQRRIRDIDVNPPVVFGKNEDKIKRLLVSSLVTDSSKHNNSSISQGIYASGYKRIITLDSLATNLKVYKLNNKLEKTIGPQSETDKEIIIIGFAYSEREQRIGATRKDCTLQFWDKQDQFKFQKCFNVNLQVPDYQTSIWYLERTRSWVTTDKTNSINVWDLEQEVLKKQIWIKDIQGSINEMLEISHTQMVAIASQDKKISVMDFDKDNVCFTIDLGNAGIHQMVYSYGYQCLITAGYENMIKIFRMDPQFLDYDAAGQLLGHQSMVTAVQIIDKTPMIVSTDDQGNIKTWDIRSMKCLQTISIGFKAPMTQIISIPDKNMICLVGSRLNFIQFDQDDVKAASEDSFPVKVEFNPLKKEIIICTRKDMRFLRIKDGRVSKIYSGLLKNSGDEIATFASLNQYKNFILGDQRGSINLYQFNNGELIKNLLGHSAEITSLKVDFANKLILSSGFDSTVLIQKETSTGGEQKRMIINSHFKKQVNLMEVSLYHSIIATSSSDRQVYLWDYEYMKLIGSVELERGSEPTGLVFINGYRLLLIATNSGRIYVLRFSVKEFKISFEIICSFNLTGISPKKEMDELKVHTSHHSEDLVDEIGDSKSNLKYTKVNKQRGNEQLPFLLTKQSDNPSQTKIANFLSVSPPKKKVKQSSQVKFGSSHQSNIQSMPSGSHLICPYPKVGQGKSQLTNASGRDTQSRGRSSSPGNTRLMSSDSENEEQVATEWVTKFLTEIQADPTTGILRKCTIYTATNKGKVSIFSLDTILQEREDIELTDHDALRVNYNPLRSIVEDFSTVFAQITQDTFHFNSQSNRSSSMKYSNQVVKILEFQSHKDTLTTFSFIEINKKCLLTSSLDQHMRIWTLDGEMLGNLNINHPLPITWKVLFDEHDRVKKKIFYALKILDIMLTKYKNDIYLRNIMQIDTFLNSLLENNSNLQIKKIKQNHDEELKKSLKNVSLMKDEFTPKDIKYEEIKHIFEKELRGISLKQMEANKRLIQSQVSNEKSPPAPVVDLNEKRKKQDEQEVLLFLQDEWRNKIIFKGEPEITKESFIFGKKIDQLKNKLNANFNLFRSYGNQQTPEEGVGSNSPRIPRNKSKISSPKKTERSHHLIKIDSGTPKQGKIEKEESSKPQIKEIKTIFSRGQTTALENENFKSALAAIINIENRNKKQIRNRTVDFLQYAKNKNYLEDNSLQQSEIGAAPNTNNSSVNSTHLNPNQSLIILNNPSANASSIRAEVSVSALFSRNNSTTVFPTDRSAILSGRSISVNHLKKAKMNLALKNIDSKLRQCHYHTDKYIINKFEKLHKKDDVENYEGDKQFLMDSIVQEALKDGDVFNNRFENKGNGTFSYKQLENFKGDLTSKNGSSRGSFTDRPVLKLPRIFFQGDNANADVSQINTKNKKNF